MSTQLEPRITRREDAESIRPFGIEMKVMMAAAQTSDTCSVLIGELKPGEGPLLDLHRGFDDRVRGHHLAGGSRASKAR